MKSIHLQAMGMVGALPAREIPVGGRVVWNYGYVSEIVSVSPRGKTQLTWVTRSQDGKLWTRVIGADRLVAVTAETLMPSLREEVAAGAHNG